LGETCLKRPTRLINKFPWGSETRREKKLRRGDCQFKKATGGKGEDLANSLGGDRLGTMREK